MSEKDNSLRLTMKVRVIAAVDCDTESETYSSSGL